MLSLKALLREPLVHFFVLGLAVFGLFYLFDDAPPATEKQTIVVSIDTANRLVSEFKTTWRRPPEPEELNRLIAHYVREEVYVREATALGLDRGDAIIRRRLQLKMEFLTEAGAEAVDPDDATLAAHMADHPERFARAPLLAFEQVFLDDNMPEEIVLELKERLELGANHQVTSRPSLLPPELSASPPQVIDSTFGTGFSQVLLGLPVGEWSGPVASSFGQHLVRVSDRRDGGPPPLAEVRSRVLQDWRTTFAADLREQRYEALRSRYEITVPDAVEVLNP